MLIDLTEAFKVLKEKYPTIKYKPVSSTNSTLDLYRLLEQKKYKELLELKVNTRERSIILNNIKISIRNKLVRLIDSHQSVIDQLTKLEPIEKLEKEYFEALKAFDLERVDNIKKHLFKLYEL